MLRKRLHLLLFGMLFLAGAARPAAPTVVTVAGIDWTFPAGPLAAAEAPLGKATGLAVDLENNIYISDYDNRRVFKVTPQGALMVVAGNGSITSSGDGGPATQAGLNDPEGVAVDRDGVVYISDWQRVRRVGKDGVITTLAGPFGTLKGMAVDNNGNVLVADWSNSCVRKIAPDGKATVVAGTAARGFSGDGGPATEASLSYPNGVALDAAGNLYIADGNSRIRKVSTNGIITTVAGGGGGDEPDYVLALTVYLGSPAGIASDPAGNLFVTTSNNQVYKVTTGGVIYLVAGKNGAATPWHEGGLAQLAPLSTPTAVTVDSLGNVYFSDADQRRVRMVDSAGLITTFAGNGRYYFGGDGGPATEASLMLNPRSPLALDQAGNLYAGEGESRVRRIDRQGTITTFAGAGKGDWGDKGPAVDAGLNQPMALATDQSGNLYITDSYNAKIKKVSPDGTIVPVVASGLIHEAGVTPGAVGMLIAPSYGLAVDADGNIYFTESYYNRIRKVTKDGVISIIAGTGTRGFLGDGGPATKAQLSAPEALAIDTAGNLYFWDSGNYRVRKVGVDGNITTVAGNGKPGFAGDNGPALEASFGTYVGGLAVDQYGVIYVSDSSNNRVRLLFTDGTTLTLAGGGTTREEGAEAHMAILDYPGGITVAQDGTVYVALTATRTKKIKAILPAKQ